MSDDFPRADRPRARRMGAMDLHVAARLKRRRLRLRLEPQLLDVAIGEQSGTVERVEMGDKRLGASQLYMLAVVLGVDVPYFFADDADTDVIDNEDEIAVDIPATDHQALSEAKRFARACARISNPEIKQMIKDLLNSLVAEEEIPAIASSQGHKDVATDRPALETYLSDRPRPCEDGHCGAVSDAPAADHWRSRGKPRSKHKRVP